MESSALDSGMRYCTRCGRELTNGRCPVHGQRPPAVSGSAPATNWAAILAIALAVLLPMAAVFAFNRLAGQERSIAALERELAATRRLMEDRDGVLAGLGDRISHLERELRSASDPTAIADEASDSVFTVRARGRQGSGFIIRAQGRQSTLITNFHVVEAAWEAGDSRVTVVQNDRTFEGAIVEVSQTEDLAAVEVRARLDPLQFTREPPAPGDTVVAIGSPSGLEGTVSTGVVSANRAHSIQFTAPVSPGSSGGPVLDLEGQVIGVVARKVAGVGYEGLSFATPTSSICATVIRC